ncbi:hypothetical protein CR513_03313, partial [Mucuna pruriens]
MSDEISLLSCDNHRIEILLFIALVGQNSIFAGQEHVDEEKTSNGGSFFGRGGIARMKHHLAATKINVSPCTSVPDDVKE